MRFDFQQYKHHASRIWGWLLSKDIIIFLMFVGLVSIVWWGRTMSSSRDSNLRIQLNYSGVEDCVHFSTPLPSYLNVSIRDTGRQLRQISKQDITLTLNLSSLLTNIDGTLILDAEMLRPRLQDILPGSTLILHITPEQIKTQYSFQEQKVVPIVLCSQVECAPQHQLKKQPILSQDSVCIYGTKQALNSIQYIQTDSINILDLRDSVTQSVALLFPSTVRSTTSHLQVTYLAEQFTDKSFILPIKVDSVPVGEHVRIFPPTTKVMVRVGMSHYSKVTQEDFVVTCQYPKQISDALNIEIHTKNPYISNIRCLPSSVEYIIER